jgi:hypothetical protein
MCFDYELLKENYGVNLEIDNNSRSEESDQSEARREYKY